MAGDLQRSSGKRGLTYDEAIEEALRSGWAATNHARVARLIAEARMAPAGMAKVGAAKADGSWDRLVDAYAEGPPKDLIAAFRRHRGAARYFAAFPPGVQRQILGWIATATNKRATQ